MKHIISAGCSEINGPVSSPLTSVGGDVIGVGRICVEL